MDRMSSLSQRILATSAGRPERPKTSAQSEVAGARGVGAPILGTSIVIAMRLCMSENSDASQLWQRRSLDACGQRSASDGAGVVRRWFSTGQGGAHGCALEYDWTSLLCFCENDGSMRSLALAAPPITGREVFWYGLGCIQWRLILDPVVDAAGLAGL